MTEETTRNSVGAVQIDGLVVMKIMKHCTECLPDLVHGQLLGLDVGKKIEVTDCFPFPSGNDQESAQYQIDMMTRLREINVDNNAVGWYQSTYLGFLNSPIIGTQFNYQSSIEKSIVIVYDPYRSSQGKVSLRAFRLSKTFMENFKPNDQDVLTVTPEMVKEHGLTHEDIFDEYPVEITNPSLMRTLLSELENPEYKPDISSKLNLGFHTFTEKNLELLIDGTDEITADQNKFQYYLRNVSRQKLAQENLAKLRLENEQRIAEGIPPLSESELIHNATKNVTAPNRLESLLTANQVSNFCSQVDNFATNTFTKMHVLQALQKGSETSD